MTAKVMCGLKMQIVREHQKRLPWRYNFVGRRNVRLNSLTDMPSRELLRNIKEKVLSNYPSPPMLLQKGARRGYEG
ncbi:hypothetical protein POVWA2_006770 [Plasmodium ovale wallikeri]|uniref:Uncharacterized protein n=1 Tax=Plasmodium ovale wallikeri TaxID=864142 RepID=A0A1A8YIF3_PLAOA|nr:hypothetical protein POVWA1_006570 [Plasmodium ovale wallikeri]SBT31909.1 hypothetical protein POVWA2_006770 [Plasmodium ovale wallikeri]